ncbi:MAG: hypothetical protein Q4C04_01070 [Clostridia bacterium]|nr:hypothetical protein [Clostridia bacterium]
MQATAQQAPRRSAAPQPSVQLGGIAGMFKLNQWIMLGISGLMFILLLCTRYISGIGFFNGLSSLRWLGGGTVFLLVMVWIFTLIAIAGFVLTILKLILRNKLPIGKFEAPFFFMIACASVVVMFIFVVISLISLNAGVSALVDEFSDWGLGSIAASAYTVRISFAMILELILALAGIALRIPAVQALLKKVGR